MTDDATPRRIARLRRDQRGYPVPWFVATINGVPDFRVVDVRRLAQAVDENRCFICGDPLGRFFAFVVGPMCAINRVSSEPPSHRDCAIYAAKHCPFLANPAAVRRASAMPEDRREPAGIHLERNPGVALVWNTDRYGIARVGHGPDVEPGILFELGSPLSCEWFAEGRAATRGECLRSIEGGFPFLLKLAERDGPKAVQLLERQRDEALELLPR